MSASSVKGVNVVTAKGRTYYYHRKSGRPIRSRPQDGEKFAAEVGRIERAHQAHLKAVGDSPADKEGLLEAAFIVNQAQDIAGSPAIYFLTNGSEILYVGQSKNVYARLAAHTTLGEIKFKSAFIVWCNEDQMDDLERRYIAKLKPKHNIVHVFGRTPRQAARSLKLVERETKEDGVCKTGAGFAV